MPAPPSAKGELSVGKDFGSGEGTMKRVARREVLLGLTAFVHNFEF
jgi:hypothetical protein